MEKTVVELISQGDGYRREAKKDSVLKSAEAEMGGVREENYKSLQLRFFDILQNENSKESIDLGPIHDQNGTNEQELVSLCLGRSPLEHKKDGNSRNPTKTREGDEELKASLTLSLDPKSHFSSNPSPEDSLEEVKEAEEPGEAWPPSKIQKRDVAEEAAQQCHAKKARVCVRARCDTPTLFDGCQWRKYGQKIAKGNPCPRSYYRCTVAPACSVRKQVQRCAEDMSILMTTYEGNHNHPLPHSATAMASTTSAAASMLLSGSSASQPGLSSLANATSATDLNGLNFSLYDSSRTKQFYLPPYASSSMFPTITLDLTASPSTSSSTPSNSFPLTFTSTSKLVHPTSLNLSSNEFNILPAIWGNENGFQSCSAPPYYQTSIGSFGLGRRQQGHQQYWQQSYIEKNHQAQAAASQQALTETLTKAITSDPGLITVIAAALSSTMEAGTGSSTINGNQGPRESFGQNLKLGEPNNQAMTSNTLTQNEKACASAYFSGLSSSASPLAGSFLQVQPPSPFPIATFKDASLPDTNKEQNS